MSPTANVAWYLEDEGLKLCCRGLNFRRLVDGLESTELVDTLEILLIIRFLSQIVNDMLLNV